MINVDLIDDLAREKVVLFLGAGVSAGAKTSTGKKIPGWDAFLLSLCGLAPDVIASQVKELLKEKDYLLAGEILQVCLGDIWDTQINEQFGQRAVPSELHRSLISLGQRITITTNFDKVLEFAFDKISDSETHYPIVISKMEDDVFRVLKDHSRKYIIKIHGTVDDPASRVFSRSEYIRLAFGNAHYSGFLESLLLNYTFIFVGFSMNDPAISSLMEMYALRFPRSRPHYILSPAPIQDNILDINRRLRKLTFITYDASHDHSALADLVREMAARSRIRRQEIFAEQKIIS